MTKKKINIIVSVFNVVIGVYLVLFHDPLTKQLADGFSHSAVGLGTNHLFHTFIGLLLLSSTYLLFRK